MSDHGPRLSAWLDGELPADAAAALAAEVEKDPALRAELAGLRAANDAVAADFAEMLAMPVPLSLVRAIGRDPAPHVKPAWALPNWAAIAASVALLALGGAGGFIAGQREQITASRDWVSDIAEYHAVYAAQKRHLVEVPASEAAHIKTWLTAQVGTPFEIPDLAALGLEFQGARLLVAAGKPVGQLMYLDTGGRVVALCFVASDTPASDEVQVRDANGFQMRSWGVSGARYVLIGPQDLLDLSAIVKAAQAA